VADLEAEAAASEVAAAASEVAAAASEVAAAASEVEVVAGANQDLEESQDTTEGLTERILDPAGKDSTEEQDLNLDLEESQDLNLGLEESQKLNLESTGHQDKQETLSTEIPVTGAPQGIIHRASRPIDDVGNVFKKCVVLRNNGNWFCFVKLRLGCGGIFAG